MSSAGERASAPAAKSRDRGRMSSGRGTGESAPSSAEAHHPASGGVGDARTASDIASGTPGRPRAVSCIRLSFGDGRRYWAGWMRKRRRPALGERPARPLQRGRSRRCTPGRLSGYTRDLYWLPEQEQGEKGQWAGERTNLGKIRVTEKLGTYSSTRRMTIASSPGKAFTCEEKRYTLIAAGYAAERRRRGA